LSSRFTISSQQQGIGLDADVASSSKARPMRRDTACCDSSSDLARRIGERDTHGAALGRAMFGTRQRQQAIGQVHRRIGGACHALHQLAQLGRIEPRAPQFAQGQFGLRLQDRQRRAQLVRGIGDEAPLRTDEACSRPM
jgi:hypothetical protein